MHSRRVPNERFLIGGRSMPAWFAGVLFGAAAPLLAQPPALPAVTVGAGVQTSFVHNVPDGGDSTDDFLLNSVRLYVNGSAADERSSSCSTPSTTAPRNHVDVLDAVGAVRAVAQVQHLGRPLPSAERPRQPVRPVLRQRLGGLHRRHPGRLSVRLPGPRQRRRVLGPVRQGEGSAGAFDGASATGDNERARRRPRAGRFLGSGRRLLPERHLLRRQEPARHRRAPARCRAATTAVERRLPAREESCRGGGAFTIESEYAELQPAGRLQRAATPTSEGGYVLGELPVPEDDRHRASSRSSASSPRRTSRKGVTALDPTTTRRRPRSTSTTSSRSSTRA